MKTRLRTKVAKREAYRMLADGKTIREICNRTGYARRTVTGWLSSPEGQEQVEILLDKIDRNAISAIALREIYIMGIRL